ncbi:hypothetical protein [Thermofilum sp.]|nr:hypothetical protein [Thermofilum sp.]
MATLMTPPLPNRGGRGLINVSLIHINEWYPSAPVNVEKVFNA